MDYTISKRIIPRSCPSKSLRHPTIFRLKVSENQQNVLRKWLTFRKPFTLAQKTLTDFRKPSTLAQKPVTVSENHERLLRKPVTFQTGKVHISSYI